MITFTGFTTVAQSHIVRGKVSDDSGSLPGVTVYEVDDNDRVIKGTITDIDGNYMIEVSKPDATLKFSFIGYETKEVKIEKRKEIDVTLSEGAVEVEEVVVTAERTSKSLTGVSKRDQTGSSTLIQMDALDNAAVSSVGDALQGQVAGMDILGGGSPGSGSSIVIRGLGSLGNSNPLIVVDGIVQKVSTSDVDFGSADTEDIGMLVNIAPEDISSVRVLKDAAETAIWGTKGANGVLEIETHRGSKGKTKFNVTYKKSFSIEPQPMPLLNGDEYVMLQQEMWHNAEGIFSLPDEIANDKDFIQYHNYSQNTDWLGEITRIGQLDDFGFKFSGGGDKTRYYTSVNYQNETGTVINTANKRFTTRINLDYKISNKLSLNTQISYVNIHKDDNFDEKHLRSKALSKAPNMAVYEYDVEGNMTNEYFTPEFSYQGNGEKYYNPVAIVNLSDNDIDENSFQTNFELRYNVSPKLVLKETVSFQFQNKKRRQFLPYTAIGARWVDADNNSAMERNTSGILITTRTMANYTPISNNRHSLSCVLMWETNKNTDEWIQTHTGAGASVNITQPNSNTIRRSIASDASVINSVGALGQIHYKYRDRHIFMVNARADASSIFGSDYRWGLFPSVSYAWRFSDEEFLYGAYFLNEGKFRVSYGRSGNAGKIKAYDRHGLYQTPSSGDMYLNIPAIMPVQVELQDLRWETSDQLNIGIDVYMFQNKLSITGEYYNKQTIDILRKEYNLPSSSGYPELRFYNEGGINNKGWELAARYTAIRSDDLKLNFNFNIYANQNSFTSLPKNVISETTDISNGSYPTKAVVGTPVGSFFGFKYKGVYPTTEDAVAFDKNGNVKKDMYSKPIRMSYDNRYTFEGGDAIYRDVNYDGVIDLNDVLYLGDSNPDFAGGFGVSFSYKEFGISSQFIYRVGYQIVNQVAMDTESMSNKNNQSESVLRRWRRPGDDFQGMLPRAYQGNIANNLGSDRYVEDGDFLKFNNVSLSYTFDRDLLKRFNIDGLKFGLQGRKLFTFTNYTGQDPELKLSPGSNPLWFGQDEGKVPPSMYFAFNVKIDF